LHQPAFRRALIARIAGVARIVGDPDRPVQGLGALLPGQAHTLTFCDAAGPQDRLTASKASVIAVHAGLEPHKDQTLIIVEDPRAWFIRAVDFLLPGSSRPREPEMGVHPRARVHAGAEVSSAAAVGEAYPSARNAPDPAP
jgi:UDP-3-O-[3-hydroxymyristoyl] glucosamine N-acyltransferase